MIDDFQPVFIIGAGRSGTKLLRDILVASDDVAAIPYDVGYVWRYKNEWVPHDEFTTKHLNDSIKNYIRKTLPKLVKKKDSNNRESFLLEKSVPNSLRVKFVRQVFPNAKFIHLIRDGRAVVESSTRMWNMPPEKSYLKEKLKYFPISNYRYAFWYVSNLIAGKLSFNRGQKVWGPRYKGMDVDVKKYDLDIICARQWKCCVQRALEQFAEIPENQVATVTYEDLVKEESIVSLLCDFIGISDNERVLEKYRAMVTQSNLDKWRAGLTLDRLKVIESEIKDLLEDLGYH